MSKTWSYDVDVVMGDGYSCEHRIDDVADFTADNMWMTFKGADGKSLAVFNVGAVVSVIKDVDSGKDTDA